MRRLIALFSLVLAGCSNAGQKAEDQYRMVERANPSPQDLCEAGKKVAEGYLEAGDQKNYGDWKNKAEVNCMNARLGRELGTY